MLTPPGSVAVVSTVVLLAALLLALLAGLIAGAADIAAGAAIGLSCCLALGAVAASTPLRPSIASTLGYTMWWGSQAGMWVWLMVGFAAVRLARAVIRGFAGRAGPLAAAAPPAGDGPVATRTPAHRGRAGALASCAAVAVVLAAGAAAAGAQPAGQDEWSYRPIGTVDMRLYSALGPSVRTVLLLGAPDTAAFDFRTAAAFSLRSRGIRVLDPAAAPRLNSDIRAGRRAVSGDRPLPARRRTPARTQTDSGRCRAHARRTSARRHAGTRPANHPCPGPTPTSHPQEPCAPLSPSARNTVAQH